MQSTPLLSCCFIPSSSSLRGFAESHFLFTFVPYSFFFNHTSNPKFISLYIYIYKNRALISRITVGECSKKNLRDEDRSLATEFLCRVRAAKSSGLILGSKLYNSLPGISCAKEFHPRDNYPWPRKWRLSPLLIPQTDTNETDAGITNSWPTSTVHKTWRNNGPSPCTRPAWKMPGMRPRLSVHAATSQTSRLFPRIDTRAEGRERKEAMISIRRHPSRLY